MIVVRAEPDFQFLHGVRRFQLKTGWTSGGSKSSADIPGLDGNFGGIILHGCARTVAENLRECLDRDPVAATGWRALEPLVG
jgi:hypothetical protein